MEIYVIIEHYWDWQGSYSHPIGYYTSKEKAEYDCELLIENEAKVGGDSSYWVKTEKVNQETL
jgi:hypothetical protein